MISSRPGPLSGHLLVCA